MEIVAQLGDIGHVHHVAAVIEEIQRQRGHHGIAHIALLLKQIEALAGAGAVLVPISPFVHDQLDFPLGIEFIHGGAVSVEHEEHIIRAEQLVVPAVFIEMKLVAAAERAGVIMNAHAISGRFVPFAGAPFLHEAARPFKIRAVGSAHDEFQVLCAQTLADGGVANELAGALFGRHLSAAAPVFIADAPEADVEGLRRAVGRALVGQRGQALG